MRTERSSVAIQNSLFPANLPVSRWKKYLVQNKFSRHDDYIDIEESLVSFLLNVSWPGLSIRGCERKKCGFLVLTEHLHFACGSSRTSTYAKKWSHKKV